MHRSTDPQLPRQRRSIRLSPQSKLVILIALAGLLVITILSTGIILNDLRNVSNSVPISGQIFTPTPHRVPPVSHSTGLIARENKKTGTKAWEIDPNASSVYIQAYAGAVSAQAGDAVPLYASTVAPTHFDLHVYRLGWYGGLGGHLYFSATNLLGTPQGCWSIASGLVNCPTCTYQSGTDLIETGWSASYTLQIGSDWPTGVYVVQLTTTPYGVGAETYIPLVVRDDSSTSNIIFNLPVNTYQAYNWWGVQSLHTYQAWRAGEVNHGRSRLYGLVRPALCAQ
jgi:hypothetical protein